MALEGKYTGYIVDTATATPMVCEKCGLVIYAFAEEIIVCPHCEDSSIHLIIGEQVMPERMEYQHGVFGSMDELNYFIKQQPDGVRCYPLNIQADNNDFHLFYRLYRYTVKR